MQYEASRTETLTYQDGTPVLVRVETTTSSSSSDANLEVALHVTDWIRTDTGEVLKYINENEFQDCHGATLRRTWFD